MAAGTVQAPDAPPPRRIDDAASFQYLQHVAGVITLTAAALRALVTPPFHWRRDFVDQCWTMVRLGIVPLAISMFFFSFGPVTIGTSLVLEMIGSEDRMAVIMPIASVREVGPFLTGIVLAGVIGTAICADLGARRVRKELDAMSVMGVDPVRKLVAPRLLALVVVIPLMTLIAYEVGMLAALTSSVLLFGVDGTVFLAAYGDALVTAELIGSLLKAALYGLLIGSVFCYAGLNASGGSEGVGRAVNQAVVAVVVAILVCNFAYNSALLSLFPELQSVR